ncbi:MAG: 50S ribosomal protein L25/general stress protein Ctc [Acidobacteriota bacterium]
MADLITIRAEARDRAGKGAARATRRDGRVPGVLYGDKKPPVLLTVDPRELDREVHKPGFFARLLNVEVNGSKERALPRDVQFHPVSDKPLHVDFLRVGAGARIVVAVPVHVVDVEKSPGIKRGGIVNLVRHEIELYCNADDIPRHIEVSLDGLEIGDSVHIKKIALPAGTKPVIARDFTVATVAAPTVVREELAAAQAAAQAAAAAALAAAEAGIEAGVPPAEGGTAAPTAGGAAPAAGQPAAAGAPAKGGAAAPAKGAPAKG